jgi:hypothetical protein
MDINRTKTDQSSTPFLKSFHVVLNPTIAMGERARPDCASSNPIVHHQTQSETAVHSCASRNFGSFLSWQSLGLMKL